MNNPHNHTENEKNSSDSIAQTLEESPIIDNNDEERDTSLQEEDHREEGEDFSAPVSNSLMSSVENLIRGPLLANLTFSGISACAVYIFYHDYDMSPRFSSLLIMLQLCCITLLFIVRKAPGKKSQKPLDWTAAILSTALLLFIARITPQNEVAVLMLLQLLGILIGIVAIISLNTSFAIAPAIREIKTGGLYNIVRHPIYSSYLLTATCIVLQNFSFLNAVILAALYSMNIHRIKAEEEILSENPHYEIYKMRVRWKLIPFIW